MQIIAALIEWFPKLFDWLLAPGTFVLALLALNPKARPRATIGLLGIAALSVSLLSISFAGILYVSWEFGRVALDLLLNFGPLVTLRALAARWQGIGLTPNDVAWMIATTAGSAVAAVAVNAGRTN
jgi:hypothetical protein